MTVVLVHGNPETDAVWTCWSRGWSISASTSPCGCPRRVSAHRCPRASPPPSTGTATGSSRGWEAIGEPVHLVGHDWGGGHVVTVAMTRPDLLRSWCSDIVGVLDPDHVWHDLAQAWQQPDAGEQAVTAMAAAPVEVRAAQLANRGMGTAVAGRVAAGFDAAMGQCIRALYRSAAQPVMARLGAGLEAAAARPGLAITATGDHMVGTDQQRRRCAARAGARLEVLDGFGHWWAAEDPRVAPTSSPRSGARSRPVRRVRGGRAAGCRAGAAARSRGRCPC